jgi:hypothetical protein
MKSGIFGAVAAIVGAALIFVIYDAVVLTAGCQFYQPNCIEVKVISEGGNPVIQRIPDHKVSKAAVITWKVVTGGYTFADGGINFYPTTPKPGHIATPTGEFHHCGVTGNGAKFQCEDAHQHLEPTGFGYTVTLQGSPTVAPLDPFVINN